MDGCGELAIHMLSHSKTATCCRLVPKGRLPFDGGAGGDVVGAGEAITWIVRPPPRPLPPREGSPPSIPAGSLFSLTAMGEPKFVVSQLYMGWYHWHIKVRRICPGPFVERFLNFPDETVLCARMARRCPILMNEQAEMNMAGERKGTVQRDTKETQIFAELVLDGTGRAEVDTGVAFFDHMLTLFAVHGLFDLTVRATGDLAVDAHHTVEDVGICLGAALAQALGDRGGIRRYGDFTVPMDEALASVTLDLSNRPFLVYNAPPMADRAGEFETELAPEFFRAFCQHGGVTLHVRIAYGSNTHHMLEAAFKAWGRALGMAAALDPRRSGVPSSKGTL